MASPVIVHDMTEETSRTIGRWRRMILRLRAKADWHAHGLLLWLLQRPQLRYAPFPYPSIQHVKQWEDQAVAMTLQQPKAIMHSHWQRGRVNQVYTAKNLLELGQFRNRVGLQFAFMEDVLLQGMLAARANKGVASQLKKEAIQEAQIEAKTLSLKGEREEAARQLIGPKGGLPSLKADLVRLATLLQVPVEPKMTIEQLKLACKPVVNELMQKPKSHTGATSSTDPPMIGVKAKPKPSTAPPAMEAARRLDAQQSLSVQDVHELMAAQDQKFQTMLNQVLQHVTTQPAPKAWCGHPMLSGWDRPDAEMPEGEYGWSQAEIQQMNADYYQDDLEWRNANGIPPRDL